MSERPAWSPDGTRIAFIDEGNDSLRQLDLRTRHVTTVARPMESDSQSFSWSPRGNLLAYLRPAALRVVRADGSHDRALLRIDPTKLGDALVSFAWSPDAKNIATLDDSSVSVVHVNGAEHRLLFGGPHFTPDNIRITAARDTQHLVVSQPDGSERRQLTTGSSWDSSPRWSPDGRQIAFARTRTGDDELYVMNADGSGMRELTHNPAEDLSPSWSSDGRRLAFASSRGGSWAIWTISIDGSDARKFATGGRLGATAPVWSPEGRWIAYGRVDQPPPIVPTTVIARADTGAVICTSSFSPVSWSPDSRQLELGPNKPGEAATIESNCTPGPVRFGDIGPFLWPPDGSGTLSCAELALYVGCDADWQPLPPAKAR
jgi:Tol biopolymer transport system component